ncbi:vanadium-dependent haloperoxidase [Paraliomyxa miuraensis]|uniref:vanadium-dependent haloperoxidase n=1 Tax=Paraliomyxa miuraensis TaxID=376150 RepID=UPI00224EC1A2|nr:vanadium-dependent haloperoxidase [Paraliomyxa miuraensis]MCX4243711.1 vanadium-dependent haloperoxidase [Paraliomyxa miuraensis]
MESKMESKHTNRTTSSQTSSEHDPGPNGLSRRELLRAVGRAPVLGLGLGAGSAATATLLASPVAVAAGSPPPQRRNEARKRRNDAAQDNWQQWKNTSAQPTNGDEAHGDRRGSFHKCLPHNALGEVIPSAYGQLLDALDSGDAADFDAISLDPSATRRLVSPQASLSYVMSGVDPHFGRIAAAPSLTSLEAAAEMGELYWAALTRDVPFRHYSVDPTVGQAVADLNAFTSPVGPKVGGQVTAGTFLRGETPGDLVGPYLSQLLWQPVPYAAAVVDQRYVATTAVDFMTDFPSWLSIQRGAAPVTSTVYLPARYIHDGRTLAEYVHLDIPFQAFLFGALVLLSYGPAALAPSNPYTTSPTQEGFVTFGPVDIVDLVSRVASVAMRASWHQKWLVHRRLRPEAYGGRLTVQLDGIKNYGLPSDITDSVAVTTVLSAHGTALLPQAYPEGSPVHPAYPAGHATAAGACATMLKALFDESFVIPNPVEATADGMDLDPWAGADLTIGGEVNKLAANISLGRDTAGVHYRSDGVQGMRLGEQVALALLADESRNYNEDFGGFELTTFDGTQVLIVDGQVHEV